MKHLFVLALGMALLTGCKKSDCVQCARQVVAASQPSAIVTDYKIVYVEYCGRQADTAMTGDPNTYSAFLQEHNLVAYTCFYNQ